jgi:hypothetical protein
VLLKHVILLDAHQHLVQYLHQFVHQPQSFPQTSNQTQMISGLASNWSVTTLTREWNQGMIVCYCSRKLSYFVHDLISTGYINYVLLLL